MTKQRRLIDLVSVGPATVRDLEDLGITEVEHLVNRSAVDLYQELQLIKGGHVDICCQDVFEAAIAQARDPRLPKEKCQWPYYSRRRKAEHQPF
jgi:hypothetical protein